MQNMGPQNPSRRGKKDPPLGETGQETLYLRFLSEKQVTTLEWIRDGCPAVDEETEISDRNSLYVFKAMWRQRLRLDLAALRSLTLPVQVLAGEFDRLTPPAGAARLARSLRHCDLSVLPRCGHQIPLEQPRAVIDAVLARGAQ